MLSAAHKGRTLMGGCLTQAYNADARTGRKSKMGRKAKAGFRIGPSKRNMPPPGPDGFGVPSCLRPDRTVYQQKFISL